jgi:hypothetical protein
MVRFWKILEVSSFVIGAAAFFFAWGLQVIWFDTASLVPIPQLGVVNEFSIHGKTVYITIDQQHRLNAAFLIAFVGGGLAGWIQVYKQPFSRRGSQETSGHEGSS